MKHELIWFLWVRVKSIKEREKGKEKNEKRVPNAESSHQTRSDLVQSRSKLYRTDFLRPSPFPYTQHFTLEANMIQWLLIQQLVITGWGRIYFYALTVSIQTPTFRIFQGCPYQYITYSHQVSPHSVSPFPVPRIVREVWQHYPAESPLFQDGGWHSWWC